MTDLLQNFHERLDAEHAGEVERGEHDSECESRPNCRLCHCAKRRRVAAGFTEPPGELIHQAPLCPRCEDEVNVDADGFDCSKCSAWWDRAGMQAEFTDDYGDLSPAATL